jgi:antitoxin FitA
MASITIRQLEESTKKRLRIRAAEHGTSMEDEARRILRTALADRQATAPNLAQAIRRRFEPFGGLELELPPRQPMREPPKPGR